ncbi:hypothetical protein TRICI_004868 [Trichomonascus ciferrii]|uniref:Uncharacterized protein n=1 Tax=Trichomonascus ciferrii TaxID=44093 RepID=A0A642V3V4_9ASCO|nr:hypothetical protein TRICI_004868 [Trichomonascus ciferrii]
MKFFCFKMRTGRQGDEEDEEEAALGAPGNTPVLDKELFEESVAELSPYYDDAENNVHRMLRFLAEGENSNGDSSEETKCSRNTHRKGRLIFHGRSSEASEGSRHSRLVHTVKKSWRSKFGQNTKPPPPSNNNADCNCDQAGTKVDPQDSFKLIALMEDGHTATMRSCRNLTNFKTHGIDDDEDEEEEEPSK